MISASSSPPSRCRARLGFAPEHERPGSRPARGRSPCRRRASAARSTACTCRSPRRSRSRARAAGRSASRSCRRALARAPTEAPGRKIDPIEVAGDPAVGRDDHDAGGVGVQLGVGVIRVAKADGLRKRLDRRLHRPSRNASPPLPRPVVLARDTRLSSGRRARASSAGLMLKATTSKSLPAASDSGFRLRVSPFKSWLQSIGQP